MADYYNDDREVTYEIVEEIGIIASQSTGWTKELNVVSWNGGQAKYDIREWSPHHDRMSRGITLNEQEMRSIIDLLKRRGRRSSARSESSGRVPSAGSSDSGRRLTLEQAEETDQAASPDFADDFEALAAEESADGFEHEVAVS